MQGDGVTTHRFVCVLSKKIENGRALNALGHMAAGLVGLIGKNDDFRFRDYVDADGNAHKNISDNPFIVLSAKNSNKLRTLKEELIEKNIPFTDFINTMVEGTYFEQHQRTNKTKEVDLEYFGICFFAEDYLAKQLTKKFSLFS
ncbi:MAG: hypothetical protein UX28_C0003G0161 [Candidatus Pacebacteria bacterium GW2011_GWA1_46_10]|nr:MAG: hypothetical protein UX28_C0003G0161 [Candidatus Pacebacteria bacterium GW2011_GWA1_46_10]HCR81607.1 DUF2000 domain-containing protein [Candidatus Paceibacterota bacterium]